ncbi:Hypothetical protein, putative [Bodo saltans]|uniref:Uncharacterized protein n=1 Tax=Bodo saltans TaxID=75058 RepID=A0A0S4JFG9_BODSA|nr:Hypothetical protein, putative [Bodo saltans]|eukprot:CUG90248.1 Hypothetical protein, putative [Bodo saltans]
MSLVSSSGARLDSSATATAEVESALPLLTFLLQQYGAQQRNALVQPPQRRVAAVTLESLWVNMEHEWRFAIQAFIEGVKSSQLTTEVRLSFQSALSSLVLLVVVARHLLGLHRVSWVHAAESLVFGDLFPSIMGAFSSVHDPTWDEFYAGLLPVLGAVASTASSQTCRRSSNNSDGTAQQTTTGGSGDAMEWCKSVLLSCEADVPLLCRNIALLLSIALEVDLTVTSSLHVEGDTVQHAFTAVFLQCANMLSDPALTKLLMRAAADACRDFTPDFSPSLVPLRRPAHHRRVEGPTAMRRLNRQQLVVMRWNGASLCY